MCCACWRARSTATVFPTRRSLELLVSLAGAKRDRACGPTMTRVRVACALGPVLPGAGAVCAVRDGLADFYVIAGRLDDAEALF